MEQTELEFVEEKLTKIKKGKKWSYMSLVIALTMMVVGTYYGDMFPAILGAVLSIANVFALYMGNKATIMLNNYKEYLTQDNSQRSKVDALYGR